MKPFIFVIRTIGTGLLAVLPVFLTILIIGWVGSYLAYYIGPESWIGARISRIGAFVVNENLAYLIGAAIVITGFYFLGLLVQTRLSNLWDRFLAETLGRLPLIGTIYKTLARFVSLLERKDDVDVHSMSPVWCYFSDERRTAVLGLMPTAEPVYVEGEEYRVVMVPTAPVPFGGGLFFLPAAWVRPAPFGMEALTNIYVSMGVTAPDYMKLVKDTGQPTMISKDQLKSGPTQNAEDGPPRTGDAATESGAPNGTP
ncbi:MAG: DUF502 domain-containing protein [Pseudomonadota bacterium]